MDSLGRENNGGKKPAAKAKRQRESGLWYPALQLKHHQVLGFVTRATRLRVVWLFLY